MRSIESEINSEVWYTNCKLGIESYTRIIEKNIAKFEKTLRDATSQIDGKLNSQIMPHGKFVQNCQNKRILNVTMKKNRQISHCTLTSPYCNGNIVPGMLKQLVKYDEFNGTVFTKRPSLLYEVSLGSFH